MLSCCYGLLHCNSYAKFESGSSFKVARNSYITTSISTTSHTIQTRRSSVETQTGAGGSNAEARSVRSKGSTLHLQRWMTQLPESEEMDNPEPDLEVRRVLSRGPQLASVICVCKNKFALFLSVNSRREPLKKIYIWKCIGTFRMTICFVFDARSTAPRVASP